jgi:hypothetical protein
LVLIKQKRTQGGENSGEKGVEMVKKWANLVEDEGYLLL